MNSPRPSADPKDDPLRPSRSDRRAILDRVRSRTLAEVELPTVDSARLVQYEDLPAQFTTIAESVGATVYRIDQIEQVAEHLRELETFQEDGQIVSLIPEAMPGNIDIRQVDDPHMLAALDWVIAPGGFGVAENGAIWVSGATLPHRTLLFIPQHLALVVRRADMVPHLHAAYERIEQLSAVDSGSAEGDRSFGVFVSGPSKTADIEQSLVLGAHGCRTLAVFLLNDG